MGTLSNSHASIKKLICENEVNIQRASWIEQIWGKNSTSEQQSHRIGTLFSTVTIRLRPRTDETSVNLWVVLSLTYPVPFVSTCKNGPKGPPDRRKTLRTEGIKAKPNQHDSNQKLKLASDLLSFPSLQVTSCNGKLIKVNLKLRIRFLKGILNSEIHPHRAVCKGIIDTEYINGKIVCTFPKISKTPPCWGVGGGKKLSYK
ncbi:Hypothetical predicted protein [Marmota monax]|uniref:Uncharacterized protein n=1 Tax=Marmota monax TaxID=9995 RepID=A0A5E4C0A0_MARMO|nr:Hypothetical predicted protein [Marmota monax]